MLFALNSLLTTVANVLIGLFVFLRNPKRPEYRNFFFLSISIAFWIATLYWYYTTTDPVWVLHVGRFNFAAASLAVYYLYRFVYEFPRKKSKVLDMVSRVVSVITWVLVGVTAFTPLVDKNEIIQGTERFVEYGVLYPAWAVHFIGLLIFGLVLLVLKIRKSKGTIKIQQKFLLGGLVLAFGLGAVTNIILPYAFGIYSLQPVGPVGTLGLTGLTAYAIVKHKFLDVTVFVTRAVSYLLLLLLVVLVEIGFVFMGMRVFVGLVDPMVMAVIGATIIVMAFDLIRKVIVRLTEKVFFKGRYSTEEVLTRLTKVMAEEIKIDALTKKLLAVLTREMRITSAAFVLMSKRKIKSVHSVGFQDDKLLKSFKLVELARSNVGSYVFEEMENGTVKELFRKLDMIVLMSMKVKGELIGVLVLGPKSSGDIYAQRDLELLNIFESQAAVALQNAQSYSQIQKFSRTLEKKVEERTAQLKITQKSELKKAGELLKLKDEFVFIATHDLRTPVTAIRGFVELIERQKPKFTRDTKESFEAIVESSGRLNQLVDDLLEVARSESGTIKIKVGPVDVNTVIEKSLRQLEPVAKKKKVKLESQFDKRRKTVLADEEKLKEIIENLLSNAVKFNRPQGKVTVSTRKVNDSLEVSVIDTGYGVPEDQYKKMFSKFFKYRGDKTQGVAGTGLGLFVVRMLVEKMKGKISFTSKKDQGMTFVFSLPLTKKSS